MSFHLTRHLLPSRECRDALPCARTMDGRFIHTD